MHSNLNLHKTVVVVTMEDHSFDHLLGYLRLPPSSRSNVEGIQDDPDRLGRASSLYNGSKFAPFLLDNPHERDQIDVQIGAPASGVIPMNGFVTNYATAKEKPVVSAGDNVPVTGYFGPDQVPITDFLTPNVAAQPLSNNNLMNIHEPIFVKGPILSSSLVPFAQNTTEEGIALTGYRLAAALKPILE